MSDYIEMREAYEASKNAVIAAGLRWRTYEIYGTAVVVECSWGSERQVGVVHLIDASQPNEVIARRLQEMTTCVLRMAEVYLNPKLAGYNYKSKIWDNLDKQS